MYRKKLADTQKPETTRTKYAYKTIRIRLSYAQFKQYHDRITLSIGSRFHYEIEHSGENWTNEQRSWLQL